MDENSEPRVSVVQAVSTVQSAVSRILKWGTNETFRRKMLETVGATDVKEFNARFDTQINKIASQVNGLNNATEEDIPNSFDKILEDVANIEE